MEDLSLSGGILSAEELNHASAVLTTTDSSACHLSFLPDHTRSRLLKRRRRMTKTMAEPTIDPPAAIKKPFMPYAKPHSVTSVVCPISGGNETHTDGDVENELGTIIVLDTEERTH